MTIAVNQAITLSPYYTQKRGNKMPSRLTFCFIFHSTFLFQGFDLYTITIMEFGEFSEFIVLSAGGHGPDSWEVKTESVMSH